MRPQRRRGEILVLRGLGGQVSGVAVERVTDKRSERVGMECGFMGGAYGDQSDWQ